ncbi:hypothetical protein [Sulfurovum sp.]|uniref:hypothetical protein n=1 Tax=Sulfurovum sp. TaxID=1969726 RepID=UPI002867C05F|nr:hypothetical protein [Sulfurovum sp.]
MATLETVFDINRILVTLFNTSTDIRKEHNIDLVYDMNSHIPKELRGDSTVLLRLLTQLLSFVFKYSDRDEILLTLSAPNDFLFEEDISFKIKETGIGKEKILAYLETNLSRDIESLGGKILYKDEDFSDVSLDIPFKINELGFRRHYRLPNDNMLDKKVLIICESAKVSKSLEKLFQYFNYDVVVGLNAFKENGSDLRKYDIFLTEEKLSTGEVGSMIVEVEEINPLRLVILKGKEKMGNSTIKLISSYLSKPITQESIYNLIIKLFDPEFESTMVARKEALKRERESKKVTDTVKEKKFENNIESTIEAKKAEKAKVLDVELGKHNAKKLGLVYKKELKHFLDTFDRSDIYFRDIVNEKSINKIKDFCVDLEKQARVIGAESMLKFADIISLIFVYDKLDMLPIYPGRYHLELTKLIVEIKKHIKKLI